MTPLTKQLISIRRAEILRLASLHGASNVRVFGSAARGEDNAQSDIDIMVDLEPGRSLFDLGGLLSDLQTLLGRDVDVITEQGLPPSLQDRILQDAVPL